MTFRDLPRTPQPRFADVKCDRCEAALEPVLDDQWWALQPKDGLVMQFQTGYGMAYDAIGAVRPVVLCGDCTEHLLAYHPYMRAALIEACER